MIINPSSALTEALGESDLLEDDQLREIKATLQNQLPDSQALARELVRRGWITSYQSDQLLRGNGKSLVLGQYLLLDRLGEGGMGQVFKARHRLMKRVVALKIIHPDWLSNRNSIIRFHREIEAVGKLSHPNIVTAHDADQVGNTHFLVMEYVEGVDLATLVGRNGPLPVGQACEFIRQAAEGLQHAFERGMVHRDIKPSNLLVTSGQATTAGKEKERASSQATAQVKILDMGLARFHVAEVEESSDTTALTQEGAVMGTADYISPEQATNARAVDIRADIYSLGCTFYFLLTNKPPFPGGTFMEKLFKHKLEAPSSIRALRSDVPAEVAAIVFKMMAKRPEDRYSTPTEVASALAPHSDSVGLSLVNAPEIAPDGKSILAPSPLRMEETLHADLGAITPASGVDLGSAGFTLAGSASEPRATAVTVKQAPSDLPSGPVEKPRVVTGDATLPHVPTREVPPTFPEPALVPTSRKRWAGLAILIVAVAGVGAAIPLANFFRQRPQDTTHAQITPPEDRPRPNGNEDKDKDKNKDKDKGKVDNGNGSPHKPDKPPNGKDKPEPIHGPPPPPRLQVGVLYNLDSRQPVTSAVFSADGQRALIGSPNTVWLYDVKTVRKDNKPLAPAFPFPYTLAVANRQPLAVALSTRGDQVLFGTHDRVTEGGQLRPPGPVLALWDVDQPDLTGTYDGEGGDIHCVALSPGGGLRAISGGRDRSVCVWDLEKHNRRTLRYLSKHTDVVDAVTFSPDGRNALSGSRDRTVCLWNLIEGKPIHVFEGHDGWVTSVTFSSDGQFALSGSNDATARYWSIRNPAQPPLVLKGHNGPVRCVAISPDGRYALTGSDDTTLRMWKLSEGRQIASFSHDRVVVAVAFSPDGRYALSAGKDHTIQRWELPE